MRDNIEKLYRHNVGMVITNNDGKVLVAQRKGSNLKTNSWQMPQGGVNANETEENALFRELEEEISLVRGNTFIVSSSKDYYYYNIPDRFRRVKSPNGFIGQKQRWFLLSFTGEDDEINVNTKEPEFQRWKWVKSEKVIQYSIFFKRKIYKDVLSEFDLFNTKLDLREKTYALSDKIVANSNN